MMAWSSVPGLIGLGVRRVSGRLTGSSAGRMLACIGGVAVAIAVLVMVTGLALGLAGTGTVEGNDVDYWVVAEDGGVGSTPFAYEGTRLSNIHQMADDIAAKEGVTRATPVALEPIQLTHTAADESAYVLAMGIVPAEEEWSVLGFDVSLLDATYPYYSGGEWSGELLASPAASTVLSAEQGTELQSEGDDHSFTVTTVVDEDPEIGVGEVPVVVVHLAELQSLTGLAENDLGNQILVSTNEPGVNEDIEDSFAGVSVTTEGGFDDLNPETTDMPFALAVAATITSLGLGILFVATIMGLELTATRTQLATLKAIGYGNGAIACLLLTETVTVALIGSLIGVVLGFAGIFAVNAGIASSLDVPAVASADPLLIGYGIAAGVFVGIVSVSYPLYVAWRTNTLEELTA